jgi:mycoredoxin-dependent peroxiredoxin
MPVEVGQRAPDFTLRDQNGQKVTLSSFRGRQNVLLVFYPFAFSRICTSELCQVRDDLPRYQNPDLQILAISVDSPYALKSYAEAEGYEFPLLADFWPHGAVAKEYGVFNGISGMANRGTFLIDKDGVLRFTEMNAPGEARDQAVWQEAIAELAA